MGLSISNSCELYCFDTITNGENTPVGSPQGLIHNDATIRILNPSGIQSQGVYIRDPSGTVNYKIGLEISTSCRSNQKSLSMLLDGLDLDAAHNFYAFSLRGLHQQLNHFGVKRSQRPFNNL